MVSQNQSLQMLVAKLYPEVEKAQSWGLKFQQSLSSKTRQSLGSSQTKDLKSHQPHPRKFCPQETYLSLLLLSSLLLPALAEAASLLRLSNKYFL